MEKGYKVFTVQDGAVTQGALVESLELKGAGITIPAILVGESGRGRQLGVLPVELLPASKRTWEEKGKVEISLAKIGTTRSGRPKLIECEGDGNAEEAIVVLLNYPGYRGGCAHYGDIMGLPPEDWPEFPGQILARGVVAQGLAGRVSSGEQLVAVVRRGEVFSANFTGRLYGGAPIIYYLFNGQKLLAATEQDRQVGDLF